MVRTYGPIGKGLKAGFDCGLDSPLTAGGPSPFEKGVVDLHQSLCHDSKYIQLHDVIYRRRVPLTRGTKASVATTLRAWDDSWSTPLALVTFIRDQE